MITWCSKIRGASLSVMWFGETDEHYKRRFGWQAKVDGVTVGEGYDLYGPAGADVGSWDMADTLADVLSAWQEAMDHEDRTGSPSENSELFPRSMLPFLAYVDEYVADHQRNEDEDFDEDDR